MDKYEAPSVEMLEEALKQRLIAFKRMDNEQDHRLIENAGKIDELEKKKLELEKRIAQEENKSSVLLADLERHNEIMKEREHEKTKLIAENRQKESEKNKIMSKCKIPSVTDENTLENGRKKFEYYKNLTGIRWDHPMLKSLVKGYVTNKQDYIHPFLFDLDDTNLEMKLWEEISRSTAARKCN
ncbi:uncharacterized protein LOC107046439 isoform X2 [Diachasma alloeum]|uniref:uncharacterized protein LOC107046439 isoform X2 n=1 Tax=Diachasma alloeum TaxID=454923 RepID=UPI0007383ED7|nr:uncharacterized protein LOC107046439 isoform X2 [Diachasma alloeum]